MKKKQLKIKVGEIYDSETGKSKGVYRTYWQQPDGSYTRTEKIFVKEVEVKDKKQENEPIEA